MAEGWVQSWKVISNASCEYILYSRNPPYYKQLWGCAVKEVLSLLFSTYFDSRFLTSKLFFTDPVGSSALLDISINEKVFHLIGVYAPNGHREQEAFFCEVRSICDAIKMGSFSRWLEYCIWSWFRLQGTRKGTNFPSNEFIARLVLIDKFWNAHPKQIEGTWTDRGSLGMVQHSSHVNGVLVRRGLKLFKFP